MSGAGGLPGKPGSWGLKVIYQPPKETTPLVDIVFVHGLNGDAHDTWESKRTKVFWPVDLLPEVFDANELPMRILAYGYNANVHSFTEGVSSDRLHHHAETLASNLVANRNLRRCHHRPIIFVCHSLGGLVVKRCLIYCRGVTNEKIEHLRSVYVSTYGILFLGTPHNGSDVAKWGALIEKICSVAVPKKILETSSSLVDVLKTNNEHLQNINSQFADMTGRFHIFFFHETLTTDVKGSRQLIVEESSAAPYLEGVERMGIEATHSNMCKFDDENAPGYEAVAEALLRYSRDAQMTIPDRWIEEEKARMLMKEAKARELYQPRVESPPQGGMQLEEPRSFGNQLTVSRHASGTASPASDMAQSTNISNPNLVVAGPLFVVPTGFHPNSSFFGMKKELDTLHHRLFRTKKRYDRLMAVVICGIPGSGKSHLARQYVWNYRKWYTGGIFWIDAKSLESVFRCFWDFAQAASLDEGREFEHPESRTAQKYIEVVRKWFQARENWLLIFDGLAFSTEEDVNNFKQFLPFNKGCSILYTSVDRTLSKKQRLYEPYYLRVPRLEEKDAINMVFKELAIKNPSESQTHKAIELVRYYECLPLAVHAVTHRLSATSKPMEKYHVGGQLTDRRLAEPFLRIMNDLYRLRFFPALSLINLLSFFGHQVPVALLMLGRSVLVDWNTDILTISRPGDRGDLDTTLGILIRYGLVERRNDSNLSNQNSFSESSDGGMDNQDLNVDIPMFPVYQSMNSQDAFFPSYPAVIIDVIKIHSVVQNFCRDELKIRDNESQNGTSSPLVGPGYYDSWLIVAVRLLCKSFDSAKHKINYSSDHGLVTDYREYETHSSRLLSHFPKRISTSTAPDMVTEAHKELKRLMNDISHEIECSSPTSSQEGPGAHRSVFDRSSSSSSSVPDSSTDGKQSFTLGDSDNDAPETESPLEMIDPGQFNLGPFPPHSFGESTFDIDDGWETDDEDEPQAIIRSSPATSQMSHTTVKPMHSQASSPNPVNENGLKPVEKSSKLRPVKRFNRPKSKFPGRSPNPKPVAPILTREPVQGKSASSGSWIGGRRSSQMSASEALAAMNITSPSRVRPRSAWSGRSGSSRARSEKENVPTNATLAAKRAHELAEAAKPRSSSTPGGKHRPTFLGLKGRSSVETLHSRGGKSRASPLVSEFRPDRMSQSTYSEPSADILTQRLNALNLLSATGGGFQAMPPSYMREAEFSGDLSASTPNFAYRYPPPLPYESNIEVTAPTSRRPSATTVMQGSAHPSAMLPGRSSPPTLASDVLGRSISAPAPESMERNPSGQSQVSQVTWATDPARYPLPRYTPVHPSHPSFRTAAGIPGGIPQIVEQQQFVTGVGGWVTDVHQAQAQPMASASASAYQMEAMYGSHPSFMRPNFMLDTPMAGYGQTLEPPTEPMNMTRGIRQGDAHDAQQRLYGYTRYQQAGPPAQHFPVQMYHPNLSGPLLPLPHEQLAVPSPHMYDRNARRRRSGSSPGPAQLDGLGLDLE